METIINIVIAFVAGGGLVALIMVLAGRKKNTAETNQINATTRHDVTVFYQEQVEKTIVQMRVLQTEVKELKVAIRIAQEKYERRVGTLHEQMDRLATELGRANTQLETANKTIGELRDTIAKLREEITQLLVEKAEKKDKK